MEIKYALKVTKVHKFCTTIQVRKNYSLKESLFF